MGAGLLQLGYSYLDVNELRSLSITYAAQLAVRTKFAVRVGVMHGTTLPRIPGRDFAGTIVQGPGEVLGQSVFGSGGNLGFGRDGSHAEFVALPGSPCSFAEKPEF